MQIVNVITNWLLWLSLFICFNLFCYFRCYGSYPTCSGVRAPGLAADMHFRDNVIAFIGPACMFALEPVARLAAYWNTPIITGMGDQVKITTNTKQNTNKTKQNPQLNNMKQMKTK